MAAGASHCKMDEKYCESKAISKQEFPQDGEKINFPPSHFFHFPSMIKIPFPSPFSHTPPKLLIMIFINYVN
jgi:hypothetical protein